MFLIYFFVYAKNYSTTAGLGGGVAKAFSCKALILSLMSVQESNSLVRFLDEENGIKQATLFGAHKSHLRGFVSPWNCGVLYLSEGRGGFLRISDFDVTKYHPTFSSDVTKLWLSSLVMQILLSTQATGGEHLWVVVNGFIDGLDMVASKEAAIAGFLRFLWRYLRVLGLQPEVKKEDRFFDKSEHVFLRSLSEGSLGIDGPARRSALIAMSEESATYLYSLNTQKASDARKVRLSPNATRELRSLLFFLIEDACGRKLELLGRI